MSEEPSELEKYIRIYGDNSIAREQYDKFKGLPKPILKLSFEKVKPITEGKPWERKNMRIEAEERKVKININLTDTHGLKCIVENDLSLHEPIINTCLKIHRMGEIDHDQFLYGTIIYLTEKIKHLEGEILRSKIYKEEHK